jgi:hypothetical protein
MFVDTCHSSGGVIRGEIDHSEDIVMHLTVFCILNSHLDGAKSQLREI